MSKHTNTLQCDFCGTPFNPGAAPVRAVICVYKDSPGGVGKTVSLTDLCAECCQSAPNDGWWRSTVMDMSSSLSPEG